MRNRELTFNQIINETIKANELPVEEFDKMRESILAGMEERGLA